MSVHEDAFRRDVSRSNGTRRINLDKTKMRS